MKIINGVAVIFGIAIMVTGIVFFTKSYSTSTSFSGSGCQSSQFGADFYTYVSEEIDSVCDNVQDVGYMSAAGFTRMSKEIEWLCKIMGIVIFSIGGAITIYSGNKFAKAMKDEKDSTNIESKSSKDIYATSVNNNYTSYDNAEKENEEQCQQVEPKAEKSETESEGETVIQSVDVNSTDELKGI